jgi:hypothetical protein
MGKRRPKKIRDSTKQYVNIILRFKYSMPTVKSTPKWAKEGRGEVKSIEKSQ